MHLNERYIIKKKKNYITWKLLFKFYLFNLIFINQYICDAYFMSILLQYLLFYLLSYSWWNCNLLFFSIETKIIIRKSLLLFCRLDNSLCNPFATNYVTFCINNHFRYFILSPSLIKWDGLFIYIMANIVFVLWLITS